MMKDLAQAVALDSDGNTDTVVTGSFLLQICGSFIIVTNSGSVRFAHRSVKEYLTHSRLPGFGGFEVSFLNAHAQVAQTCLSFLVSFEDASKWARLPPNFHHEAIGLSLTGFEMYACFFWASHCEKAKSCASSKLFKHLLENFVSVRSDTIRESKVMLASPAFQRWISLLWRVFRTDSNLEESMRYRLEDAISDPPNPLFTACIWGFTQKAFGLVMQEEQLVNSRNYRGKSCLYLACEYGHDEIVTTFTRSGAVVDAGHGRWGSDLHAAASSGLLSIFSKMLAYGALVNPREGFYGRTIDAAIRGGNPAIVTHALKAGAEVWLPSAAAPIQPRDRRSRSLHSREITSSGTLSGENSVLADWTQDFVTSFCVPDLGNKDSMLPDRYGLLERLHRASRRRRELLNYWRLANGMAAVDHRASDEPLIAEEAYGYRTEIRQDSALGDPFPLESAVEIYHNCCFCFRTICISNSLSWR